MSDTSRYGSALVGEGVPFGVFLARGGRWSVGLSERALRRRFTSVVGMSWRTYLAQARIIRSMALLADPARTVLGVALEVGFENVSSFARAFGRHIGEAPSVYRRRVASERI
ncbi:MAG TPA: helix-turn-helix domain-containing protein [Ilumatobacter sp.]|nr:helix-turn-helix domain-containing protein [Ilumatobacter sp.]